MPRCYRHITRRESGILISSPSISPLDQFVNQLSHTLDLDPGTAVSRITFKKIFIASARTQSDLLRALILFSTRTLDWLSPGNLLLRSKNNISPRNCCLLFPPSQGGGWVVQAWRLLLIQYHSSPSTALSIFQHQIHHNSDSPYLVFHLSLLTWLLAVWGQMYAKY